MVGREATCSHSYNIENGWIIIDFGVNIKIKPTHYTLSHYTYDRGYIVSWNVLGSCDELKWKLIKKHEGIKKTINEKTNWFGKNTQTVLIS